MSPEAQTRTCQRCNGSGEEFDSSSDGSGGYVQDCRSCAGTGQVPYKGSHEAPAPSLSTPPSLTEEASVSPDASTSNPEQQG